jgi:hypothetical protein
LVVVLDSAGIEAARENGAPFVAAVFPTFDVGWGGDLAGADCVVVAHEALVPDLVRRGVRRSSIVVARPIAPGGWAPAADREAARARAFAGATGPEGKLDPAKPVVVVAADAIADDDLGGLLVQLALVTAPATFLFDVGDDVTLANDLRRLAPAHGLHGAIFAGGEAGLSHWQLADVALVPARGEEAVLGCAVGAGLVVIGGGRTGSAAAAWLATGAARVADVTPAIAAALELSLVPATIAAARQAALTLDAAGGASRAAAAITEAWRARRVAGMTVPRGLPVALERLPDPDAPMRLDGGDGGGGGDRRRDGSGSGKSGEADLDSRVETELAALKRRLEPSKQ